MDVTSCGREARRRAEIFALLVEAAAEGEATPVLRYCHDSIGPGTDGVRSNVLHRARTIMRLWRRRVHERTELAHLDTRELQDFGISGWDANREAAKWFWQA